MGIAAAAEVFNAKGVTLHLCSLLRHHIRSNIFNFITTVRTTVHPRQRQRMGAPLLPLFLGLFGRVLAGQRGH